MNPDVPLLFHETAGTGPPLVLLHGLSGSGRWWGRNVLALSQHFRVFAVDLAGFGSSRGVGRFRLDDAGARLLAWMDAAGIERTSLVGHSMGGLIAAIVAAETPERVDRLVLVDAALLSFDRGLGKRAFGLARSIRWTSPRFLSLLAGDALRSGAFSLASATHQLLLADQGETLARIAAPTLVIWGEHDTVIPLSVGREIVARIPGARLFVLAGAGHNAMWDRPDAFNREVLTFLRGEINEGGDRILHSGGDPAGVDRSGSQSGPTA